MAEEKEEKLRKLKPMRLIAAVGIGLAMAGLWWKYSDTILNSFIGL